MTSLVDQIRADREAGTPGPWTSGSSSAGFIIGEGAAIADTDLRFTGLLSEEVAANTRRIARAPDLESAYLASVARIERLEATLQWVADNDDGRVGHAAHRALMAKEPTP